MATGANPTTLASQARRLYTDEVAKGLEPLAQSIGDHARALLSKTADHAAMQRRRDAVTDLQKFGAAWQRGVEDGLRNALLYGTAPSRRGELSPGVHGQNLSLVDNDTIEREIFSSRLALAMMDKASWEFTDLRSRIIMLEKRDELEPQDVLRAHVLARVVTDGWLADGLSQASWRELQPALHDEFSLLVEEAYHETNRWLIEHRVLPEVDLRPLIRRTRDSGVPTGVVALSRRADLHGWLRLGPIVYCPLIRRRIS